MTSENNRAPVLCCVKLCALFQSHLWIQTWVTFLKRQNHNFFVACDLEIWRMTLKNNRAPLLCYFKLCASFHSHWWIQTGVTVLKSLNWVKISIFFVLCELEIWRQNHIFLSRATLKFDGWPWKTIGHLFYVTSSFVHHFIAICEFKLELQSGNAQFWSKSLIFLSRVNLKFDGWPWKTIGHLFYGTSNIVHHFIAISEFKLDLQSGNAQFGSKVLIFFVPCDLEIWRMTLKNNRTPLLCYFKLCESFHSRWWIQTEVTVRKRPNWGKICFDLCDLDLDLLHGYYFCQW